MKTMNIPFPSSIFFSLAILSFGCESGKETESDVQFLGDHFAIPYLDLSQDSARQFVLDREKGIYFGHPTTTVIKDENGKETVLAVYPLGAHAKGTTTLRKSNDGGKTWSDRMPGATALGRIEEVPTIHRVSDPDGKERLIIFTGLYPTRMTVSEDDGNSWSPYQPLGSWGGIVTMGDLVPIKNNANDTDFAPGKYMAFFHDDGRFIKEDGEHYEDPGKFILYKTLSGDGGLTWSEPEVIVEDTARLICEPGIVRSPDGKQLAMLLRENSRDFNSQIIFSDDEGDSWTEVRPLPASLTGDRHVIRYNTDGRIVIVFRDHQQKFSKGPTEGDYVAWVGTYEDLINGNKGQCRVRLLKNYKGYDCGYSGLELLSDGSFLATTYLQYRIEDQGNNSVVAVRFNLDEIDEMIEYKY